MIDKKKEETNPKQKRLITLISTKNKSPEQVAKELMKNYNKYLEKSPQKRKQPK
ncbi:MAG: hypothetical protein ABII08_03170 [Candidatus Beckwithbacteria bacterium]